MLGVVYVIESGDEDGHYKFGYTENDPERRVKELQTGSPLPLRLLGWFPGTRADERFIHQKLRASKAAGEWFTATAAVMDYVDEIQLAATCELCPDARSHLVSEGYLPERP